MDKIEELRVKRIRKLMKDILNWKQKYYAGEASVSDSYYDAHERMLEAMDPHNPIVHMVGFDENYKIPRGYVPDPTIVFNDKGIFRDGVEITRNQVGTFHK